MPDRLRSAWIVALLIFGSAWGVRAADGPLAPVAALECEAATASDAAEALFREIELSAYRIEALARDCHSAMLDSTAFDARRHLAAWREVLEQLKVMGEVLRSLAAGQHMLSSAQRRAWVDLEDSFLQIYRRASETLRQLGESIIGVQSEQYVRALLDTQDRSLRMARLVVALDHCGELRTLPDAHVPSGKSESNVRIQFRFAEQPRRRKSFSSHNHW